MYYRTVGRIWIGRCSASGPRQWTGRTAWRQREGGLIDRAGVWVYTAAGSSNAGRDHPRVNGDGFDSGWGRSRRSCGLSEHLARLVVGGEAAAESGCEHSADAVRQHPAARRRVGVGEQRRRRRGRRRVAGSRRTRPDEQNARLHHGAAQLVRQVVDRLSSRNSAAVVASFDAGQTRQRPVARFDQVTHVLLSSSRWQIRHELQRSRHVRRQQDGWWR